ncbi:hypothetical protein [Sulfuracidifex metallicus]|jgi:sulfur carrier protein ThiS|uniref:Thiamine biosynthesis protein ThiS n=1 Tax=Sulfuracidifex metallicus DSM 6482 = JCM 9184 TaxID=523847 RepID=A0A6A9QJ40_SULME|nr:hypothetical protein [Sulfuracidifex metallicus]MUN28240.1 thiamine biosynthesis protein ThiS [Sulfuracidifex metallicus DSM 6482 = JCM 9184]WOE51229.1 thiamine biosynthesis protein ThiS [Sulfuracidifex metallicus DSM 6482 = JCM 9184]
MKVTVNLIKESRIIEVEIDEGSTVREVLKKIGYIPQGSVVVRGEIPIPEDDKVKDGDFLTVYLVATGG